MPTSVRKRAGEAESERLAGEKVVGETGAGPGVNRRLRQEQQIKEMLQAAQAAVACAQLRAWARCQGSVKEGAGKVPARSLIAVLSTSSIVTLLPNKGGRG